MMDRVINLAPWSYIVISKHLPQIYCSPAASLVFCNFCILISSNLLFLLTHESKRYPNPTQNPAEYAYPIGAYVRGACLIPICKALAPIPKIAQPNNMFVWFFM